MDITVLFQRFAQQSPLIILCGLIIWQFLKMYKEEKQLLRTERLERQKEVTGLISNYTIEIRQINDKHTAKRIKRIHPKPGPRNARRSKRRRCCDRSNTPINKPKI
jgi:hypothetical protein